MKILRTDNGSEFCNSKVNEITDSSGIIHQKSAPYTPEQNGLVERMNRTLIEKARCMLIHSKLGKKYWAEAVNTALYSVNRFFCRKPTVKHMYIFRRKSERNLIQRGRK